MSDSPACMFQKKDPMLSLHIHMMDVAWWKSNITCAVQAFNIGYIKYYSDIVIKINVHTFQYILSQLNKDCFRITPWGPNTRNIQLHVPNWRSLPPWCVPKTARKFDLPLSLVPWFSEPNYDFSIIAAKAMQKAQNNYAILGQRFMQCNRFWSYFLWMDLISWKQCPM